LAPGPHTVSLGGLGQPADSGKTRYRKSFQLLNRPTPAFFVVPVSIHLTIETTIFKPARLLSLTGQVFVASKPLTIEATIFKPGSILYFNFLLPGFCCFKGFNDSNNHF